MKRAGEGEGRRAEQERKDRRARQAKYLESLAVRGDPDVRASETMWR